ncbi:diacylglycerol acyltransferase-domain-containing protein [Xylariales sp. AK1849]|nr:diacylglycerol acyltransferase-domain-containing protein [Xylariales sp. AK1849]
MARLDNDGHNKVRTEPTPPGNETSPKRPRAFYLNHSRQNSSTSYSQNGYSTSSPSQSKKSTERGDESPRSPTSPGLHKAQGSSIEGQKQAVTPSKIPQLPVTTPEAATSSRPQTPTQLEKPSRIPAPSSPTTPESTRRLHSKKSSSSVATMDKPVEEKPTVEQGAAQEESFIHVSEAPTYDFKTLNADAVSGEQKTNGHTSTPSQGSEKTLADQPSAEVQDGVTFADAVKDNFSSQNGQEAQQAQHDSETRSDDSYPELDEMALKEVHTHQPASRHEPYGPVRWAPFNVPAKRRLQTLTVLMHCLSIGGLVAVFFALCANPFAWPFLLVYLMHVLSSKAHTDGSLKYRCEWFRSSYIWELFAGYFPARLHKTRDLPPTRKYIFGYHPHGIISHGAWAAFATEALGFAEKFPGITNSLLTLDSNFRIPFYRDYVLWMGVRSVSKESIVNILTRGGPNNEGMGRAVTIVIGGARESLEAQPGQFRLILHDRKGFIKIAVRTGADLVPVLAFGENDLYDQLRPKEHPFVHKIQMFVLKVGKFTLPFLHGRGIFNYDVGLMPYRHPLNIVVGAPIMVQQSNNIEQKEIDRLHDLYVEEVEKLWDRYKDEFAKERKEEMQILH